MMVAASGFIGTISIPYISDALADRGISVVTSFCVACIIVLVLTIFLPESHNIPPPDVIE
jgi:zinc transporter ZupT